MFFFDFNQNSKSAKNLRVYLMFCKKKQYGISNRKIDSMNNSDKTCSRLNSKMQRFLPKKNTIVNAENGSVGILIKILKNPKYYLMFCKKMKQNGTSVCKIDFLNNPDKS